jgi:hypothetical protein
VGACPPSDESMQESLVPWLDGGSGNGKKRLCLGSNQMGKAFIYRGLQSTHSQGGLRLNLGLNRLEITILEIGIDRGSNPS